MFAPGIRFARLASTPRRMMRMQGIAARQRDHTDLTRPGTALPYEFDGFFGNPEANERPTKPGAASAGLIDPASASLTKELPSASLPSRATESQKQLQDVKIGFIGWGSMAQAISLGLLREKATVPDHIMVSGRRQEVLAQAEKEGIASSMSNAEVAEWADIVVIAVKPQMLDAVMPEIAASWHKQKLMVSVCAGVPIDSFLQTLGSDAKIVRTMPNTPSMIGEAATAYAGSEHCADWELELVEQMFSAVGKATHKVPEHLMNAVTGVSGSGPAYIYMLIQALSDAGVHSGLPRDISLSLATQTVIGAAKMVQSTGKHPAILKEAVTSPAGTTIAGVKALEDCGFNAAVMQAVHASKSRSEELSQMKPATPKRRPRGARRALRR